MSRSAWLGPTPNPTYLKLQFDFFSALGPFLRLLDSETSHDVAIWTAKHGIVPRETRPELPSLAVQAWGHSFSNPIGVGAT